MRQHWPGAGAGTGRSGARSRRRASIMNALAAATVTIMTRIPVTVTALSPLRVPSQGSQSAYSESLMTLRRACHCLGRARHESN